MCSTYVRLVSVDKDEFNRTLLVCIMLYLKLFRLILQGRSSFIFLFLSAVRFGQIVMGGGLGYLVFVESEEVTHVAC